jgi:putative membrane-bound dehydrogenase-like protein
MPWKAGLLVAVAPDLVYFSPAQGGPAKGRTLYTGFALDNIQQLLNSLQWGLDNWVYGCAGNAGGTIQSAEKPDAPAVILRGRGIRFHPDEPGSLEPTSGGGQYGLAADDWERWFTATNNQHLRHIALPDHYLRRNPSLAVPAVTLDIPDHDAACKVYRISPFEAWRVERTQRRKDGPDAKRFPSTELVPGGYITSACSPVVYNANRFPEPYRGNTFVCDPANNLVHRDILKPQGATFVAQRGEADSEFLASTDTWFRPVSLTLGPDGAIYILDFYREVIETPLSLPDDIKKKLNLESRGRGRIWRVVPEGNFTAKKPALSKASTEELVAHLADPNSWWRLTAQRLLVERQDAKTVPLLEKLAADSTSAVVRVHALWTLRGLKALDDRLIEQGLKDASAEVREQALRLAEGRLVAAPTLRATVIGLAEDPSPRVRFQLAFALGELNTPEAVSALARVARRDLADPWTQTGILSSAKQTAAGLLATLAHDQEYTRGIAADRMQLLSRLAAVVGASGTDEDLGRVLSLLSEDKDGAEWQAAVLGGLGQGLQNSPRPLLLGSDNPPATLKDALERGKPFFVRAAATAVDEQRPSGERLSAIRLLGYGPFEKCASLSELLGPRNSSELQLAAVRALSLQDNPKVGEILLAPWNGYSPVVRREVVEALFARPERLRQLLDAFEANKVLTSQLEPIRIEQLHKHPDEQLRRRAQSLLANQLIPDRKKIVEGYLAALELQADTTRGKAIFKKTCVTCHRLENEGVEVGPDLLSALRTKTREGLIIDILDPSREVDPRYVNYLVTTKSGRVFTGMIAVETPSSITLRRAEKAEDTILRTQIEEVQATAKSLMPEELEKQLSKQDLADVIAYLQAVAAPR